MTPPPLAPRTQCTAVGNRWALALALALVLVPVLATLVLMLVLMLVLVVTCGTAYTHPVQAVQAAGAAVVILAMPVLLLVRAQVEMPLLASMSTTST